MVRTHHFPRGQGLLEGTLAIGIILIGLGGLLALTLRNVTATTASAQRIVALQLAREGLEVVRGIRDSNWLAGSGGGSQTWDQGLTPPCTPVCGVAVSLVPPDSQTPITWQLQPPPAGSVISRTDFSQAPLQMFRSSTDHLWRQDANVSLGNAYLPTGFYRLVILEPLCQSVGGVTTVATNQSDCGTDTKIGYRVEAAVAWPTPGLFGGAYRSSLSLVEYIYNWR